MNRPNTASLSSMVKSPGIIPEIASYLDDPKERARLLLFTDRGISKEARPEGLLSDAWGGTVNQWEREALDDTNWEGDDNEKLQRYHQQLRNNPYFLRRANLGLQLLPPDFMGRIANEGDFISQNFDQIINQCLELYVHDPLLLQDSINPYHIMHFLRQAVMDRVQFAGIRPLTDKDVDAFELPLMRCAYRSVYKSILYGENDDDEEREAREALAQVAGGRRSLKVRPVKRRGSRRVKRRGSRRVKRRFRRITEK